MNKKNLQKVVREFLLNNKDSLITEVSKETLDLQQKFFNDMLVNKSGIIKRYGKDAEKVMKGRAMNLAKKETEKMSKQKLKELVRKTLMQEQDIEVMADKIGGEQSLSKASMMLDTLESLLKSHDWWYMMSDDNRAYNNGLSQQNKIRNIMQSLEDIDYGDEAKSLYNQYAPAQLSLKETKKSFPDLTGDGKVTKADILKGRGVELDEDIDLGHQDNELHMIKGELYQIGKYAMELYAALEELEEMGGEYDFPAWWQAKITTAKNNISGAKHYLEFEMNEPKIDSVVDMMTGEEPHMGEPMMEKKLTKAEKKKKEEIVKGMKGSFKGDKDAMYAIATAKAKKVAETLAKKLTNEETTEKSIEIGDKVKIKKEYGGGSGIVKDKKGSFVVVNGESYHESDVIKIK